MSLKSYLNVSNFAIAFCSSIFHLGEALGSFMCGFISKRYSRSNIVIISFVAIFILNLLMVLVKDIYCMCLSNFMIGILLGLTNPPILNSFIEYLPVKYRSLFMIGIWTGAIVGSILASLMSVLGNPDNKVSLVLTILIIIFITNFVGSFIIIFSYRDSPRNLVLNKKNNDAMKIISEMVNYDINKDKYLRNKFIDHFSLGTNDHIENNFFSLFNKKFLRITLINSVLWALGSFPFSGLMITFIPELNNLGFDSRTENTVLLISFAFIIIAVICFGFVGENLGFKYTAFIIFALNVIFLVLSVIFYQADQIWNIILLCLMYCTIQPTFSIANLTFPTRIRDLAIGYLLCFNKLASFLSQLIYTKLLDVNESIPKYFSLGIFVILTITLFFVKKEVSGIELDSYQILDETIKQEELKDSYDNGSTKAGKTLSELKFNEN